MTVIATDVGKGSIIRNFFKMDLGIAEKTEEPGIDLENNLYISFILQYLGHRFKCNIPKIHDQIYRAIETEPRVIIQAPTRWAKSEICTVTKPLVDAVGGQKKNIMLISNTGSLAEEKLGLIKQELETNNEMRAEFDIRKGRKWTNEEIVVHSKYGTCRILSKGFGYQIRGWGFDLIVLDDLESDEMVRSQDQREKFEDWLRAALLGRAEPGCQIVWVGTFLNQLCYIRKAFYNLVSGFENWKKIFIQARNEEGKSNWEERYSTEDLKREEQEMGHRAFMAEKMGKPLGTESQIFQEDWLTNEYDMIPEPPLAIVVSDDPQDSKSEYAHWGAIVTLAKDGVGNYYLLDLQRGKWGMYDNIRALVAMDKKWKPRISLVESRVIDNQDWRQAIEREATNQHTFVSPRFIKPQADKVSRATHIDELFRKGKFFFPSVQYLKAIKRTDLIRQVQLLKDEMLEFPDGEFDDWVDALTQGLTYLMKQKVGAVRQAVSQPLPKLKPDPLTHRLK